MKLHELAPAPGSKREKRRVGRGHGSGRVKTSGRGTKGQNSRAGGGTKPFFAGGQNPWTMAIPHKRGFSRARFRVDAQVVNLDDLERAFQPDDTVTIAALRQRGLIRDDSGKVPVKVLGDGRLSKRLTLEVHRASASARAAVEQAGGTLTLIEKPGPPKTKRRGGRQAQAAGAAAGRENPTGPDGTAGAAAPETPERPAAAGPPANAERPAGGERPAAPETAGETSGVREGGTLPQPGPAEKSSGASG